jgi:hypothetical protein
MAPHLNVLPGRGPDIHGFRRGDGQAVNGRDRPGHDNVSEAASARRPQLGLKPEARTAGAQASWSAFWMAANSSGVEPFGTMDRRKMRSFTCSFRSDAITAWLTLAIVSAGDPARV